MTPVRTAIAFIIFNRPDLTERVLAEIAKARPSLLLVVADGPRDEQERVVCDTTRSLIDGVDWPCEVRRLYSEVNLGCKTRVSSGLDWVFDQVEEAIILEDDCIPHADFFRFCDELLMHYRDDERIGHIGGTDYNQGAARGNGSYYYSRYTSIWGWATWRRAWRDYDVTMAEWPDVKAQGGHLSMFGTREEGEHFEAVWDDVHSGNIDTWDAQWLFCRLLARSLSVSPNGNLISNLGCRQDATHTTVNSHPFAEIPCRDLVFPLAHPVAMMPDGAADILRASTEFLTSGSPLSKWKSKVSNKHFYGKCLRCVPVIGGLWAKWRYRPQ